MIRKTTNHTTKNTSWTDRLLFLIQWSKKSVGTWPAIGLAALRTIHNHNGHIIVVEVDLRSVPAARCRCRSAVVKVDDTVVGRDGRECPAESIFTVRIPNGVWKRKQKCSVNQCTGIPLEHSTEDKASMNKQISHDSIMCIHESSDDINQERQHNAEKAMTPTTTCSEFDYR